MNFLFLNIWQELLFSELSDMTSMIWTFVWTFYYMSFTRHGCSMFMSGMHLWHDSRVVEWCSATSLWLVCMWMGRAYGCILDLFLFLIWYDLSGECGCVGNTRTSHFWELATPPTWGHPFLLSDYLRGLPSICLWRCMTMIMISYLFLSSWYYYGSDSVHIGDCMNSLPNLYILFSYYPLYLNMFYPQNIAFVLQHLFSVYYCYIHSLGFLSSAAISFTAAGIQASFGMVSGIGSRVELKIIDHSYLK